MQLAWDLQVVRLPRVAVRLLGGVCCLPSCRGALSDTCTAKSRCYHQLLRFSLLSFAGDPVVVLSLCFSGGTPAARMVHKSAVFFVVHFLLDKMFSLAMYVRFIMFILSFMCAHA